MSITTKQLDYANTCYSTADRTGFSFSREQDNRPNALAGFKQLRTLLLSFNSIELFSCIPSVRQAASPEGGNISLAFQDLLTEAHAHFLRSGLAKVVVSANATTADFHKSFQSCEFLAKPTNGRGMDSETCGLQSRDGMVTFLNNNLVYLRDILYSVDLFYY